MLNEERLAALESGIYEFNALSLGGDEEFEDLSPRAKCAIIDMLATIRELQARVVASDERGSNYARDADRERHLARLRQIENDQMQAQVTRLQERVARLEKAADPDDDCECVVRTELEARLAELETDAKLGRMVRQLPIFSGLYHQDTTDGEHEWQFGLMVAHTHFDGDTPEAALEAAREGET